MEKTTRNRLRNPRNVRTAAFILQLVVDMRIQRSRCIELSALLGFILALFLVNHCACASEDEVLDKNQLSELYSKFTRFTIYF